MGSGPTGALVELPVEYFSAGERCVLWCRLHESCRALVENDPIHSWCGAGPEVRVDSLAGKYCARALVVVTLIGQLVGSRSRADKHREFHRCVG